MVVDVTGATCGSGDTIGFTSSDLGTGQVWTLTNDESALTPNTYLVSSSSRTGCNSLLSAPTCPASGIAFAQVREPMSTTLQAHLMLPVPMP